MSTPWGSVVVVSMTFESASDSVVLGGPSIVIQIRSLIVGAQIFDVVVQGNHFVHHVKVHEDIVVSVFPH